MEVIYSTNSIFIHIRCGAPVMIN